MTKVTCRNVNFIENLPTEISTEIFKRVIFLVRNEYVIQVEGTLISESGKLSR